PLGGSIGQAPRPLQSGTAISKVPFALESEPRRLSLRRPPRQTCNRSRSMEDALRVVVEMHESLWGRLKDALKDLTEEECHWRPIPQANTINVIIRHLRIEAQWHLNSLERGEPMPTIAVEAPQEAIDAVPADFEANFKRLEEFYTRFVELLRTATLETLQQR